MIKNGFYSYGSKALDGVDGGVTVLRDGRIRGDTSFFCFVGTTGAFCRCCAATFSTAVRLVASAVQQQTERTGRELSLSRPPRKGRRNDLIRRPGDRTTGIDTSTKGETHDQNWLSTNPWRSDPVRLVRWVLGRRGADSLAVQHHRLAG
jgi:hypothetical protein